MSKPFLFEKLSISFLDINNFDDIENFYNEVILWYEKWLLDEEQKKILFSSQFNYKIKIMVLNYFDFILTKWINIDYYNNKFKFIINFLESKYIDLLPKWSYKLYKYYILSVYNYLNKNWIKLYELKPEYKIFISKNCNKYFTDTYFYLIVYPSYSKADFSDKIITIYDHIDFITWNINFYNELWLLHNSNFLNNHNYLKYVKKDSWFFSFFHNIWFSNKKVYLKKANYSLTKFKKKRDIKQNKSLIII